VTAEFDAKTTTTTKTLRDVLGELHWLKELPSGPKERVYADAYEESFNAGEVVARRGDTASTWIGCAEGLLKISAVQRSGKVVMLSGIPEGSWVGEGSVIKRELRRCDVIAMRRSRVIHLPASTVRWLLDTSIEFNQIIVARLNERLATYIAMFDIDRLNDPVARVARALALMFNPVLHPHMGSFINLSQTELGELIGLSRQSIGAALKQLESEGLLSSAYGGVLVKRLSALREYEERERP